MSNIKLNHIERPNDKYFSLGLSYYDVMELLEEQLEDFLKYTTREEIICWLQWNDPNGIYDDKSSIDEFGEQLNKIEGMKIMKRQILSP